MNKLAFMWRGHCEVSSDDKDSSVPGQCGWAM